MSVSLEGSVETLQHPWELEQIVTTYNRHMARRIHGPTSVLEIGAWDGGTLKEWMAAGPDVVVVIDAELRKQDLWYAWAYVAGTELIPVAGRSQEPEVIRAAASYAPFDWVFIDADHQYEAAKADWENYSPMVKPGGAVAFHDIRDYDHGDLGRLWAEVKSSRRSLEILDLATAEPWGGIGVVWM